MAPVNAVGSTGQVEFAQGGAPVKSGGGFLANAILSVEKGVAGPVYTPVSDSGYPLAVYQPAKTLQTFVTHASEPVRVITAAGEQCWITIEEREARVKWDADNRTWRLFDPANTAKRGAPVKFQNGIWQAHGDVGLKGGGGVFSQHLATEALPAEVYAYRPGQMLFPWQTYTVYDAKWGLEQVEDTTNRGNFCAVFDQNFKIETQGFSFNVKDFFGTLYQNSETFRGFFNYAADYDFPSRYARALQGSIAGPFLLQTDLNAPAAHSGIWTIRLGGNGLTRLDTDTNTLHLYSDFLGSVSEFYLDSEGNLVKVTPQREALHELLHVLTGLTYDTLPTGIRYPELIGLGERGAIVYLEDRIIREANLDIPKRAAFEPFTPEEVWAACPNSIKLSQMPAEKKKEVLPEALQNIPFEKLADRAITVMSRQDAYLNLLFPLSARATDSVIAELLEKITNLD